MVGVNQKINLKPNTIDCFQKLNLQFFDSINLK